MALASTDLVYERPISLVVIVMEIKSPRRNDIRIRCLALAKSTNSLATRTASLLLSREMPMLSSARSGILERFTFGLQTERIPNEWIADDTGSWSGRSTSWVHTQGIFASGLRRPSIVVRAPSVRSPESFASASPSSSACSGDAAKPTLWTPSLTGVVRPRPWGPTTCTASRS